MRDPWNDSELARRFTEHARTSIPRAPLNAALSAVIGRDRSMSSLLGHAPVEQQLPVLLLAVVHFLVLTERDHPLADWYPNLRTSPRDPTDPRLGDHLTAFVHERSATVLEMLATRRIQTNEVGRCALFLPAFAMLDAEMGALAHVDVGTSAGLTTLATRFGYRYDDEETLGHGRPVLACSTRGEVPVPATMPKVAMSCGIDLAPLDPLDDDDARWLQACCWPDQIDRFARLAAAIDVARRHPPRILTGDAVDLVAPTVVDLESTGHPVVTTTWALNYLTPEARTAFVAVLDHHGAQRDLSWVFAEAPALTPELPHDPELADEHITALGLVTWRSGERTVRHLATCHPHGYWLHWR